MKAKNYAERYISAHSTGSQEKEAAAILGDFFKEVSALAHERHIEGDEGLQNIIVELDRKYRMYVRMVKRILPKEQLNPNTFKDLVDKILTNIVAGIRPPKKQINMSAGGIILSESEIPLGRGEKEVASRLILTSN